MSKIQQVSATIANGGTTSGEISAPEGCDLVGIFAPVCTGTALTLTAAAAPAGTFVAVKNAADSAISHTISATAHYIALDPTLYRGLKNLKLVSGSSEGAERVFTLVYCKRAT